MTPQQALSPMVETGPWQPQQQGNFISICHADWWNRDWGCEWKEERSLRHGSPVAMLRDL